MKAYRFVLAFLVLVIPAGPVAAQQTKVKWFGHAAFSITTPKGVVLLIDPWLRKNPSNPEMKPGETISFRGRQMLRE
jgi:L-ascorbate metabolism protein UlaG (beta-lactamase superfamily)